MRDARAWVTEHGDRLIGRPVEDAAAAVADAGLVVRAAADTSILTLEFRSDRVTLSTDRSGLVTVALPG